MPDDKWMLNPDYDGRAVFNKAVQDLLKVDAKGCEIIARIAEALIDFGEWEPVEPLYDGGYDRAPGLEQIEAFQALYNGMLGDTELPLRLAPLARARQQTQQEVEAEQAAWDRRAKRRRQARPSAPVVRLVPPSDDDPNEGQTE